jgi:hypothetical protein
MTWGMYGAFVFTVVLLVSTAYFLFGADAGPVRHFRRMHGAALLINVGLLAVLVWGTIRLSQSV